MVCSPFPEAIEVTVPALLVNELSLLNILNPISFAALRLSLPASSTINSSVPDIPAVISVSSDKFKLMLIVPVLVIVSEPSKPVPVVIATLVTPELVT